MGSGSATDGRDYGIGEGDVPDDSGVAGARLGGGDEDPGAADANSTTGTTPNEEFVGRTSGQDVGYAEETGAEARAAEGD